MRIAPFKIEEWMNRYEESALIDLSGTCIKPMSVNELCQLSGTYPQKDGVFDLLLDYGKITGSDRLKSAIKTLYTEQKVDNITVTHGAIGANQLVFLSLLEKDDEVVAIVPTYQQHYSIPESLGAKVKLYFLKEENNWLPDIAELSQLVTSKTKLLCLNNPNNPTGAVIPNPLLEEIVDMASKRNVWILSDEAYRGLNLIGNPYSKSVADLYSKGISVGSMSKTYSLPGLRVGWICAREDLISEANHQRQYNTISISSIDDYFASVAIENQDLILKRNLIIQQQGLKNLIDWLKSNTEFDCVIPTGGTTALIKYNKNVPSRELCRKFQNRTGVALLPGETLEMEGYVRINFCAPYLLQGLDLLATYCATL